MKVFRIQCHYYDEDGESHYIMPEVYISKEIAEKYKPEDYEYPFEEGEYEIIEQEVIEK